MAYDQGLATRLSEYFLGRIDVEEKSMFGGLCFMVSEHMCCGIVGDNLIARVGPEHYEQCLEKDHVREMDFSGKALKGMVYVSPEGYESDEQLTDWISLCESFILSLPPKNKD